MVKLTGFTGVIQTSANNNGIDQDDMIKRNAIIVHEGDFICEDGPISFNKERLMNVVKSHNSIVVDPLVKSYGSIEKVPIGAFPPIYHQHDNKCFVIGRVNSRLTYHNSLAIPKVGDNVGAICAQLTFLGVENAIQVRDGRYYNLSIGLKEDETLGEISAVSDPAAPGASLLTKGASNMDKIKVSNEVVKKMAQFSKLLELKANVESTHKELSSVQKRLSATNERMKLSARTGLIKSRLSGLMKSGKMMPSEYRTIVGSKDFSKLAKLDNDTLNLALSVFEAREKNVITAGQYGSTAAPDFSEIGKKLEARQMNRLTAEVKKDLKKLSGGKLSFKDEDENTEMAGEGPYKDKLSQDKGAVPGEGGDVTEMMKAHLHAMGKHLAMGDIEKCKEVHKNLCSMCHMEDGDMGDETEMSHLSSGTGDVKLEDSKNDMNELQSQIDELNTQLARMAGMVSELVNSEEDEGHDLEGAQPEGIKPDGEKADLAESPTKAGNPFGKESGNTDKKPGEKEEAKLEGESKEDKPPTKKAA